jgi:drug/metabolite transporter (DMT)-like permease
MNGWLATALGTVLLWGIWGAIIGLPTEHGVPDTISYVVWSLTMIPVAAITLRWGGQPLLRDRRSVALGLSVGLLGAGGQLVLFKAVQLGPPYLIFPIISLSPAVTIAMSFALLKERTGRLGVLGIALALLSLPLFDYRTTGEPTGYGAWLTMALLVMIAWGGQAYIIKLANASMDSASIFFYMMVGGLVLAPVAWAWKDFGQPVNTGWDGPWMTAGIQLLNAVGALTLVYAFRYGKAIVVAPLTNAGAPLVTAVLALVFAGAVPGPLKILGLALALVASLLLVIEPERPAVKESRA